MFFPDHWVYFAFVINWFAAAPTDPGTVKRFFAAIHRALEIVRRRRSAQAEEDQI
jgi:hypothetical protein